MKCRNKFFLFLLLFAAVLSGCATSRKLAGLKKAHVNAKLGLIDDNPDDISDLPDSRLITERDTLVVKDPEGRDVYIMKAVKDEGSGEMVANEELVAAVVTARFRNVAERFGKVDIRFQITVPAELQDSKWQVVFSPWLMAQEDSIDLEDVIVTGRDFRRSQLRGYQQYQRFVERIVTDSTKLVDVRSMEIFLERNFPSIMSFRTDSSYVSDEQFESVLGVSVHEVEEHYRKTHLIKRNKRLMSMQGEMWNRYVRRPISEDGVRLDTVVTKDGDIVFDYIQTIDVPSGLKKVDLHLKGIISDSESKLYDIPETEKLTFYISSLSTLSSDEVRYKTEVVMRNLDVVRTGHIEFKPGSVKIDKNISDNASELAMVKSTLRELLSDSRFEIDSILVSANASPEGNWKMNRDLCNARASNTALYFETYLGELEDSLRAETGVLISVGDDYGESGFVEKIAPKKFRLDFLCRSGGENWAELERLVISDSLMTEKDKNDFKALVKSVEDVDVRESRMRYSPYYDDIRKRLYPSLRTVDFKFCLHRSGMVSDTVRTNVIDAAYMEGVDALKNRNYEKALAMLAPYEDLNAAVAMIAMERNLSALEVLQHLEPEARVDYLSAIAYSRLGDDKRAVECYLHACRKDRSYVSRGNLDPEISRLIRKYSLDFEL